MTKQTDEMSTAVIDTVPAVQPGYRPAVDQFLDLELPLSVVIGRCSMQIQEVLKLTSGSVVELDRNVDDRVELFVHGKLVARGEVVSVNGNYGVRVTEVIPAQQRI